MTRERLAIIGAGPAGLGAAKVASAADVEVIVIDDQLEPGGQIWRSAGSVTEAHAARLGREFQEGRERVQAFRNSGVEYLAEHVLWNIERASEKFVLNLSGPNGGTEVRVDKLLLATGAIERPVPIPGWTLPGVMSGGGLQILLKSAEVVNDRLVLAGAGPLLWLVAAQLVDMKCPPLAVVEQVPFSNYVAALPKLVTAMRYPKPLFKGLGLIGKVLRADVPVHFGARNLRVEGEHHAEAIRFDTLTGRKKRVEADAVALHFGVIPNQQASRLLRLEHNWNADQQAFVPKCGDDQLAAEGLYLAGDGAGIGGAEVAWLEGQLVGAKIAGVEDSEVGKRLAKANSPRDFLDRLYAPPSKLSTPADETVICRCESVTAGQIRSAVRGGAMGPNQVKFMIRPGMGPCQGRMCGTALSTIIADSLDETLDKTGYLRIRPPLKPVPLSAIADMDEDWTDPDEGSIYMSK